MIKVEVLGTGCAKCNKLFKTADKAIFIAGVEADLQKIESLEQIMEYGVMMTPALVINGNVKVSGKVPSESEIVTWLKAV